VIGGKQNGDTDIKATVGPTSKADLNLEIGRNIYEPTAKESKLNAKSEKAANGEAAITNGTGDAAKYIEDVVKPAISKVSCFSCGIDCTRVYYHNTHQDVGNSGKAKYDLCPNCYAECRMPANQQQSFYVKLENPAYTSIPDRDAPWSDTEILRLLEALERYDESWEEIAEHVGTRTKEECVVKFLQFEIEDKYLDAEPSHKSNGIALLGPQAGHLPFSQADNPVMSVIGFLAGLTQPSVTAAAAGKTVEAMKQSLRDQLEHRSSPEKGHEKQADSMDIDVRHETTTTTTETTTVSGLATVPLASVAARAGALASHEEREMTRLVSAAVNATLMKFELKLKQFNEMEQILQTERRELERGRQQLFLDRLMFKKRIKDIQEGLRMAQLTSGDQGMKMAQDLMAAGNEKLTFDGLGPALGNIEPLSTEGQIKSYDI